MPAPRIALTVNDSRQELLKDGWAKSRISSSIRVAELTTTEGVGGAPVLRMLPAALPPSVWQDPDTGYVMLRPSSLRDDYAESPEFYAGRVPLAQLDIPVQPTGIPLFEEPAEPNSGTPKLITLLVEDTNAAITGLSSQPAWANAVHTASNDDGLTFVAVTKTPLAINEGVTLTLVPSGLASDRSAAWFGVMIGDRYYIQLGMNGSAALWEYRYSAYATGTADDWVRREEFQYNQGGVNHTEPFQITIFPWGMEFISVLFSQATQPNQEPRASDRRLSSNTFTFQVGLNTGDVPRFDQDHGHYVKLEPAVVRLAMRKQRYQYAFLMAKLRFGASETFYCAPEQLTEPKGAGVGVTPLGFYPGGSTITTAVVNEDGAPWDIFQNVRFSPILTLISSPDRRYTPELWGLEFDVPAQVHVPPSIPKDISTVWSSLNWRESCASDLTELRIVMRRDKDWRNLVKLDGCVTLKIDGQERWQGYITRYQPHFDGLPVTSHYVQALDENEGVPLRDNPVADDHWQRLNETDGANFRSLTQRYLGEIFREGLQRAGYAADEIDVAPELDDMQIGGFERASDWKQPNEDATIGDLFRRIIKTYGTQNRGNIRCVRRRGVWRVYVARSFRPGVDLPHVVFMLDDTVFFEPGSVTDEQRYTMAGGPYLRVLTQPEIEVRRPEFNELRCFTTDEPSENAIAQAAFIAAHPRTLTDPTYVRYEGRARPTTMGPSDCGHLSTQNEIERFARRTYDEEYRKSIVWTHAAEWQPSVEPDQFAWVVGRGPDGYPVSYGVWRIEEVEITIDLDNVPDSTRPTFGSDGTPAGGWLGDRSFTWQADYTLAWESAYEEGDAVMWSEVYPGSGE